MSLTTAKVRRNKLDQFGFIRHTIFLGIVLIALVITFDIHWAAAGRVSSGNPEIRSGVAGYCLDDHHNSSGKNAVVESWPCNNSPAQTWVTTASTIEHGKECLEATGKNSGDKLVLNSCNKSSEQNWTVNGGGYQNLSSGLCLSLPANNKVDAQVVLASCNNLSDLSEAWAADYYTDPNVNFTCDNGSEGQRIACYAKEQWLAWQSGSPSHQVLLSDYTDGNSYEQWCADFVSYVYKEAGYPFTAGERNGWDEYDANNLQNMNGLTMHQAGSYVPKPGDIAYFDYNGGHVEIVEVGGSHPVFIYGDSGTNDPITNNGDMNENTLTSDGTAGQVQYYLSPSG